MKIISSIIDFVFPRQCHICGETLGAEAQYICAPCLSRLPRTLFHRVPDNPMERRFMGQFPFRAATGHFFYSRDSDVAALIHDFKYRNFQGLARYMGEVVASELLTTGFLSDIDFILPIPMHFLKKAGRGYNQTEEICKGISKITGIKVNYNLVASRGHRTQTSLTLEQRIKNLDGVFRVKKPEDLNNKKLLLVDDVCTTGSTLSSAASIIAETVENTEITLLTIGVTF